MALTTAQIQNAYVAFFNRPADAAGLNYWSNYAGSLQDLYNTFAQQPEYTSAFAGMNNTAKVNQVYTNLLSRTPDTGGLAYWVLQLDKGLITLANLALAIVNGAQGTDVTTINNKVSAATTFTASLDTTAEILAYATTGAAGVAAVKAWLLAVTNDPATLTTAISATTLSSLSSTVANSSSEGGQPFTLTTGVDAPGFGAFEDGSPNGNANIRAIIGADETLNDGDYIQASGTGNSLTLVDDTGGTGLPLAVVTGIATLNMRSAAGVGNTDVDNFDLSGWTGLTAVNVTGSNGAGFMKVAGTTAVTYINKAGLVTLSGGLSQNVTTAGGVALSGSAGAITVVDSDQGEDNTTIDGGTTVTLTVTDKLTDNSTSNTGKITIGDTTEPTGAVVVNSTIVGYKSDDSFAGDIVINGGTTVTVNQTASQAAVTATQSEYTVTQSDVTVNGTAVTTAVTVNQSAAVAEKAYVAAKTGKSAVYNVTFSALDKGDSVSLSDDYGHTLTFTAAKSLTADQVASAFANLVGTDAWFDQPDLFESNEVDVGNAGAKLGTFEGNITGWTSGSASSAVVTFTSNEEAAVAVSVGGTGKGTGTAAKEVTAGVTAVDAEGAAGIVTGDVVVVDVNYGAGVGTKAGTITSVTLNNYTTARIDNNNLTSLTATGGGDITIRNASNLVNATTTLNFAANGVGKSTNDAAIDDDGVYTTVNVTTSTKASHLDVSGLNAMTTLSISGSQDVALTVIPTTLKTLTLVGAGALTADLSAMASSSSVNASASTGANEVSVDASKTSYVGGSGAETITLTNTTISKSIALGGGDDTVVIDSGTSSIDKGVTIDGGAGVNTLQMTAADAQTVEASLAFIPRVNNFQVLSLTDLNDETVDLLNFGLISSDMPGSVVLDVSNRGGVTLRSFDSGGTLTLNGNNSNSVYVNNTDWDSSSSINVVVNNDTGTTDYTKLYIGENNPDDLGVSSVHITSNIAADVAAPGVANYLYVYDYSETNDSLETITVDGDGYMYLYLDGAYGLNISTIDASDTTGGIYTYAVAESGVATTITGGSGNDKLYANGTYDANDDILIGGAGDDYLMANKGANTLTGGSGNDIFDVGYSYINASDLIYTTITDFLVGDVIYLTNNTTNNFITTKFTSGLGTTVQDLADLAITGTSQGDIRWFQVGNATYIVQDNDGGNGYTDGTDLLVKLTGLIDLSEAGFSTDYAEIQRIV